MIKRDRKCEIWYLGLSKAHQQCVTTVPSKSIWPGGEQETVWPKFCLWPFNQEQGTELPILAIGQVCTKLHGLSLPATAIGTGDTQLISAKTRGPGTGDGQIDFNGTVIWKRDNYSEACIMMWQGHAFNRLGNVRTVRRCISCSWIAKSGVLWHLDLQSLLPLGWISVRYVPTSCRSSGQVR